MNNFLKNILILEPKPNEILKNLATKIEQENSSIFTLSGTESNLVTIEKSDIMNTRTYKRIAIGDSKEFKNRVSGISETTISTADTIAEAEWLGVITSGTAEALYNQNCSQLTVYDYQTYKNKNKRRVYKKFQPLSGRFGINVPSLLNYVFKPTQ